MLLYVQLNGNTEVEVVWDSVGGLSLIVLIPNTFSAGNIAFCSTVSCTVVADESPFVSRKMQKRNYLKRNKKKFTICIWS